MKNMKHYLLSLILILPILGGCSSFLNELPDDRTVINSSEKVKELLVSAYPEGHYMMFTEQMSDNVEDVGTWLGGYIFMVAQQQEAYSWKDVTAEAQDTPTYYWQQAYKALGAANTALEAIEEMGESEEVMPYKGEALLARAYAHFMLVNLFAEHYDPLTADRALGIPLMTAPEKNALVIYERATVAEVYEMIEDDIINGLPLIRNKAYDAPKYHFNVQAAHAFASRFYLYRGNDGDWEKVLHHANQVLGAGQNYANDLRDINGIYQPLIANFDSYNMRYTSADEPAVLLLTNASSVWWRGSVFSRYILDINRRDEIYGKKPVSGSFAYGEWGVPPQFYRNKMHEYFKFLYPGSTSGLPYNLCPVFTVEEVVFNRAEANVMLGNTTDALADLNTFLSKRLLNYDPVAHELTHPKVVITYATNTMFYPDLAPHYSLTEDQQTYIKCITDFRRKEFCQEGMRWFDIKRFHIEVEHGVYGSATKLILKSDDPRRAIQIPSSALSYGMTPNPR